MSPFLRVFLAAQVALGVGIPVSYAVRIMFSMEAAVQGRLLERLPRDRMLNTERHMTASR